MCKVCLSHSLANFGYQNGEPNCAQTTAANYQVKMGGYSGGSARGQRTEGPFGARLCLYLSARVSVYPAAPGRLTPNAAAHLAIELWLVSVKFFAPN